ncbi:hypothetical protein RFI_35804 [Reticulomyxa filosa]|uniref:Uncharacterized protein n=1 Tax=Reticulomyxa filosa TaxID=46433 RepID=X6LJT1_RETFI|nr:hypothetical protein RFI_35804 [Reticulomyxa filosa]|eukprot:ETO01636.1 hypothetical protein RFI_35804 [Reticulomyxa filosa]
MGEIFCRSRSKRITVEDMLKKNQNKNKNKKSDMNSNINGDNKIVELPPDKEEEKIECKETEDDRSTQKGMRDSPVYGSIHELNLQVRQDDTSAVKTQLSLDIVSNAQSLHSRQDTNMINWRRIEETLYTFIYLFLCCCFQTNKKKKETKLKLKNSRRVVFIDMKIKRVSDIDTTKEQFRAKFHYYLTWLATKEEHDQYFSHQKREDQGSNSRRDFEKDHNCWKPHWIPYVEYVNAIEIKKHKQISLL